MTVSPSIETTSQRALPSFPSVALRRARSAARAGDFATAEHHYAAFLRLRPQAVAAWIQLGHVSKQRGDLAAAERAYRQAVTVAPHNADAHRQQGLLFERLGQHERARRAFLRGLAAAPEALDLQDALTNLGMPLHELEAPLHRAALEIGEASAAERRHGRPIWTQARCALHAMLAGRTARAARWPAACRQYRLSLATNPNQPDLHLRLGRILLAQGDPLGGTAAFRRAISWSPHRAELHIALGQGLSALGDTAGAEAAFAIAVRLAPASDAGREALLAAGWLEQRIEALVASTGSVPPAQGGVRGPQDAGWRGRSQIYTIPSFLLRPPSGEDAAPVNGPWRLCEPDLGNPTSQLCTAEQMRSPEYAALCARLGLDPSLRHRKCWEHAFIYAALQSAGCLAPGRRGLGFGIGREPLPAAFASRGVYVTATDAPAGTPGAELWTKTEQRAQTLDPLFRPDLVSRAAFDAHLTFRAVDMNAIPADLRDYDFCWSSCCLEHLGSLRHGLDFIANSLQTLRPGGVAVHTTEFNLTSNAQTFETPDLSLFRRRDIEELAVQLTEAGHRVRPLNFWPGVTPVDEHIDLPPFGDPHLKLQLGGYVTTSIGLIIQRSP